MLLKIKTVKEQINRLGELRPGSLSKQYNVCGSKNCKCKDKKNPQKHGPYYQLSYTYKNKSKTEFIRKKDLETVRKATEDYKEFIKLKDEWIEVSIELSKLRKLEDK